MNPDFGLSSLAALVLLLNFCLLWFLIFETTNSGTQISNLGSAFLFAAILWGLQCVAITEFLSLFGRLNYSNTFFLWTMVTSVFALLLFRSVSQKGFPVLSLPLRSLSLFEKFVLGYVALNVIIVGCIAWIAPPNNTDAMQYHLPRIMHWIQNQSVAFYPTHTLRQLGLNPAAEYAMLQFQILSGTDSFANLIQWFTYIGSIIGIALIARAWGGNRRTVIFSVVLLASLPLGILQASSAKNEYVVTFWLICFVFFITNQTTFDWRAQVAIGGSLGLALLTKQTAYIFVLPWFVWFGVTRFRSFRTSNVLGLVVVLGIVFSLIAPQMTRNYSLFGSPLGPTATSGTEEPPYTRESLTPNLFASSVIKNLSVQLQTPTPTLDSRIRQAVLRIHRLLGVDVNDPRDTVPLAPFYIPSTNFNDMVAGNPLHGILVLLAIVYCLVNPELRRNRVLVGSIGALTISYFLFILVLRYQLSNVRLQFPVLALFAVPVGFAIGNIPARRAANLVILVLVFVSVPWLFLNQTRPLLGANSILSVSRNDLYFAARPELREPYTGAIDFIESNNCTRVGLYLLETHWQYPFWIGLMENHSQPLRIEHVNVRNASVKLSQSPPFDSFMPCAIIMVDKHSIDSVDFRSQKYSLRWSSKDTTWGSTRVYLADDANP